MLRAPSDSYWNRTTTSPGRCCPSTAESRSNGFVGDTVDLHFHFTECELRFHRGPRGPRFPEELGIHFVHGGEVLTVRKKNGTLDYVGGRRSRLLQNPPDVLQREASFMAEVAE